MKNLFEKKINKLIIGGVIGSALVGIGGLSMSKKGKSFWKKIKERLTGTCSYVKIGYKELKQKLNKFRS